MKFTSYLIVVTNVCTMVSLGGCDQSQQGPCAAVTAAQAFQVIQVHLQEPFSKVIGTKGDRPGRIETFVALHDQFGDPIKALGEFRFEIYRYRPAFADPRGRRFDENGIQTIDLSRLETNQNHWDKITRSYRFDLKLPPLNKSETRLVLQVTFMAGSDYRLQDMIQLNR